MQKSENAIEFRVKLWYNICARDRVNLLKEGISMKKALVLIMILLVAICIVACGTTTPAETTGADTTAPAVTTGTTDGTTPTTTNTAVTSVILTDSKPAVVTTAPAGEKVETVDYTAVLNGEKWTTSEADKHNFDIFGTGVDAVTKVNSKFGGYKKNYTLVNANGEKSEISNTEVRKLSTIGIVVAEDKANKVVNLEVHELEVKVLSSWSHITAKAGSYLMFDITTNIPVEFATTVTAEEGGAYSTSVYTQKDIYVTGENGTYVGTAKCQVPYSAGSTMYINICLDTSVPVVITPMRYESPFRLKIEGDWELINRKDYISDLIDLFYNVYPRIYQRFGESDPNVPMTITFKADKNSEAIAYNAGTLIAVQTGYANDAPYDIGFFAHELGHAIQQYGNMTRKLSVVDKAFEDDDSIDPVQIVDGGSIDPFTINKPLVQQENFYGMEVYKKVLTIYDWQLDQAFSGPDQFASFIGMMNSKFPPEPMY